MQWDTGRSPYIISILNIALVPNKQRDYGTGPADMGCNNGASPYNLRNKTICNGTRGRSPYIISILNIALVPNKQRDYGTGPADMGCNNGASPYNLRNKTICNGTRGVALTSFQY